MKTKETIKKKTKSTENIFHKRHKVERCSNFLLYDTWAATLYLKCFCLKHSKTPYQFFSQSDYNFIFGTIIYLLLLKSWAYEN